MASDKIINVTEQNFKEVTGAEGKLVFLDFWAAWCGPCRTVAPILEKLAEEYGGRLIIGKVNVDENQNLAMNFGITSIPTIIVYKDGKLAEQIVGLRPYEQFKELADRFM